MYNTHVVAASYPSSVGDPILRRKLLKSEADCCLGPTVLGTCILKEVEILYMQSQILVFLWNV